MSHLDTKLKANAPDGVRLYAIGDIHGRLDLLETLIALIQHDNALRDNIRTMVIFLGDYVDRGPDSKGVVDSLINIRQRRNLLLNDGARRLTRGFTPLFLKGNHEALLLSFLHNPISGFKWLQYGGDATLLSYGFERDEVYDAFWGRGPGLIRAAAKFRTLLPDDHLRFYESLELFYRAHDYFFVHAGIKPGVGLDNQKEEDLLWIRKKFVGWSSDFGAVVVHGHTPVMLPENLHNRINIDTAAFRTGKLSAVGLEGTRRWFLST